MVYLRAMGKEGQRDVRRRRFAVGPAEVCDGAIAILEHCGCKYYIKEELRKAS